MTTLIVAGISYVLMFGVKRLAGLSLINNTSDHTSWLRVVLLFFALVGTAATAVLNGAPVDVNTFTGIAGWLVSALAPFLAAHGLYRLTTG